MEKMMASIHQVLLKLEVEEVDLDVVVEGGVLWWSPWWILEVLRWRWKSLGEFFGLGFGGGRRGILGESFSLVEVEEKRVICKRKWINMMGILWSGCKKD